MITVVALLLLPVVLIMSIYRLVQLPRDMLFFKKWINPKHRLVAGFAAGAAYIALGGYTVIILVGLFAAITHAPKTMDVMLTAGSVLVGYPFVYLAYEWVYHYALDPRPKNH